MRSIRKGSLAFGPGNAPVKVCAATDDHDIEFHRAHSANGSNTTAAAPGAVSRRPALRRPDEVRSVSFESVEKPVSRGHRK